MTTAKIRRAGRLPAWQRIPAHLIFTVCALSGLLFFLRHELHLDIPGVETHSYLVMHGVSAAFALLAIGAVLPGHLRVAWIARRNRMSGVVMLVVMALLMLSGLMLYYGSEELRDATVLTHWIVGGIVMAAFPLHLVLGRRDVAADAVANAVVDAARAQARPPANQEVASPSAPVRIPVTTP